jgi:SAM-dependent methyltransferase
MTMPPRLTDRARLAQNRARATRAPVTFLHEEAITEVQERVAEVNREFTAPAVVTGHPEIWSAAFPRAAIAPDAETLALAPGGHDLVIHAMCLHWADDPIGQVIQCARALRPDGLFLAVFPGAQTLHELRAALAEAEVLVTGGLSPRVAPMIDLRDAASFLQRAGLALPVADVSPRRVSYKSLLHLVRDLRGMGEGNALAQRHCQPLTRRFLVEAASVYPDTQPDGRITAQVDLVFLAGWAPHEGQQKPLRPGSAAMRLAEALGTEECPSDDPAPQPGVNSPRRSD